MRRPWRREPRDVAELVRRVPRGGVAVDCGANVGQVTVALTWRCAKVVAFEPNPVAFDSLQRRRQRAGNVELVQAAVGAQAGTRRLYLHVDHDADPLPASVGSSLHPTKGNVMPDRWVDVEVIDIDAFLTSLGRPVDLLKLDVEGSEIEILERLLETGRLAAIGSVVVEMHDRVIPDLAERGAALRQRLSVPEWANVSLDWR
jgi:FkbM family methyltransferase